MTPRQRICRALIFAAAGLLIALMTDAHPIGMAFAVVAGGLLGGSDLI